MSDQRMRSIPLPGISSRTTSVPSDAQSAVRKLLSRANNTCSGSLMLSGRSMRLKEVDRVVPYATWLPSGLHTG